MIEFHAAKIHSFFLFLPVVHQLGISAKNSIFADKFEKTMKHTLTLFLLFSLCLFYVKAQEPPTSDNRDYRAALKINGRITEISVAPDERIWLTTYLGEIYYANSIDSNWHYGQLNPPKEEDDYLGLSYPDLDRISFFNADTAIMTGFINSKEGSKNGYYRTTDGGHTWELLNYERQNWIYKACVNSNGKAWLGTANKTIYYSADFGEHFKALEIPFEKSDRIYALYMKNETYGMAGSNNNEILITENNWNTARNIPTPLDQKKAVASKRDIRPRIDEVLIWKTYLIAKQCGKVFYTLTDTVDWQPLPGLLRGFTLDEKHNVMLGYDDSLKVLTFSSPTEYELLTQDRIPNYPIDIKAVNGSLYMFLNDNRVCRVNRDGIICHTPYTIDHAIETPVLTKDGETLTWGVMYSQLYIAPYPQNDNETGKSNKKRKKDKPELRWYREAELDFPTKSIRLLSDSVAILWDGVKNHRYSLSDHSVKDEISQDPLHDFLAYPIKEITISSGTGGCFHLYEHRIKYKAGKDSLFHASVISKNDFYNKQYDSVVILSASQSQLKYLLDNINANPENIPDIQDFNITETDKTRYLENVKKRQAQNVHDLKKIEGKDIGLYHSIPDMADSIDKEMLYDILLTDEGIWSTTSSWFSVTFVNQNDDTCWMESNYFHNGNPWYLPWHFEYKEQHFSCYDVALSYFIKDCITEDFYGREAFDNAVLLMKIGDYFCRKRR